MPKDWRVKKMDDAAKERAKDVAHTVWRAERIADLKVFIQKEYGTPCKDKDPSCVNCQVWAAYNNLIWQME